MDVPLQEVANEQHASKAAPAPQIENFGDQPEYQTIMLDTTSTDNLLV